MKTQQQQLNDIFCNEYNHEQIIKDIAAAASIAENSKGIIIEMLSSEAYTSKLIYEFIKMLNIKMLNALRDLNALNYLLYNVSQHARNTKPLKATMQERFLFLHHIQNTFANSNMHGKMQNVTSINTLKLCNCNCAKYQNITGSICAHCYVTLYTNTIMNNLINTLILCFIDFNKSDFNNLCVCTKNINNIVRLEALGDLINAIQAKNYMLLASTHKQINFALWTKNKGIIKQALQETKSPDNLNIILSYLMIANNSKIQDPKKMIEYFKQEIEGKRIKEQNIKCFIVADNEATAKDIMQTQANCAQCFAQDCASCCRCYTKNTTKLLVEIVK